MIARSEHFLRLVLLQGFIVTPGDVEEYQAHNQTIEKSHCRRRPQFQHEIIEESKAGPKSCRNGHQL